ncbi:uncharacterized protein L199_008518 [Kwoniella botswanensis]|uniref:uncharacterized protein n=1 Tax=Kwoniella botswanensis TaxID=1268659 RepID=UPI00315D4BAD
MSHHLLVTLFLIGLTEAEVYVGCFLPGVTEGLNAEWHFLGPTDDCLNREYTYQLEALTTGGVTFTRRCACSDKAPDYRHMAGEICHPDAIDLYGVWRADSIWSYDACYRSPGCPGGSAQQIDNIENCFSMCSESRYATLYLTRVGFEAEGYFTCYNNSNPWSDLPLSGCAYGDWQHRDRGRLDIKERTEQVFCPLGMTACNLAEAEGYECLDTGLDPESCGGCMHGQYGVVDSAAGTDCTALTGTTLYSVICSSGRCVMTDCGDGYDLIDQSCKEADR